MSGTSPSPVVTGLGGRCPRCGRGRLFRGFLAVAPRCEVCGLDLSRQDSGDGPAAFIILIVGFVVIGAALVVEVGYGWPIWLHLVVWLPLAVILCLALMRPFKGLLIALQYRHRRHEFDAG
ncbi:DUF983 domain-containing protein [Benzoatithermus flavus]|uniref:DUF983 domain-containing protein n=1 Tax=Benzoatithermus flavus TaxID=3108223 RepID=A0ABU8XNQ4_9PROT